MITATFKQNISKTQKGFTLIELLIVIGILAILMGIVLVAINPLRQFALANNTNRSNAVNQILNAVGQFMSDNHGLLPPAITTNPEISNQGGGSDLCSTLVPKYIAYLPEDPNVNNGANITDCSSPYDSGYTIATSSANRVTVSAPNAQAIDGVPVTISVTR